MFDSETWTYTYLIADPQTGEAALVDPVIEQVERDLKLLQELGLTLRFCLETHVHADHITGTGKLRDATGCEGIVPEHAQVACAMRILLGLNRLLVQQLRRWGWSDQRILPVSKSLPLLVVIAGTLLVWGLRLDQVSGVKIVGEIPAGLPSLTCPMLDLQTVRSLFPAALAITLVGYLEGFSSGQTFASKRREKVDANQEFIALGAANLGAALTGGYPVTGGLSRSVVNVAAGAKTG